MPPAEIAAGIGYKIREAEEEERVNLSSNQTPHPRTLTLQHNPLSSSPFSLANASCFLLIPHLSTPSFKPNTRSTPSNSLSPLLLVTCADLLILSDLRLSRYFHWIPSPFSLESHLSRSTDSRPCLFSSLFFFFI